ncbi:hypothetical protein SAMN04488504_108263 [Myxococcus virescens]|uniref:Uncharacterized protein n=1 Tax=Myxococcus virescens TaxID=83456 RepID=A0ABY0MZV2_9BACT|nr:hypothetical protein SAMN04488504_108263 [Myxococcus virescens]
MGRSASRVFPPLETTKPPTLNRARGFMGCHLRGRHYAMGMKTLKPVRPLLVVLRSMKSLADE